MPVDRLVFVHGFTQTHRHWRDGAHRIATRLGDRPTLAFVDLPGHGLADDDRSDGIAGCGRRLVQTAGRGTYLGYSLGGRTALTAAIADEDGAIERLILIGATAGIADDDERANRRDSDDRLADRIARVGVDAFLDEWLALPLFDGLPADPVGRRWRAANTADGLAHSLRRYGTGEMDPLWDRLGNVRVPTLLLAGERDAKFIELGRRLASGIPGATLALVPGAGHAAHVEAPEATAAIVADWLG